MALSIDEANAVSSKYFDKTITDQVYENSPFYVKLKSMGNVSTDGGTSIQFPIKITKLAQTGFVGPRQQVSYSQKETRTGAVLDWKYLIGQTMISWDERVKNSGKPQIVNLLRDKNSELKDDVRDIFSTALYATSPGSDDISSLPEIIDSTTTYAGIAYTDAAEWTATEDTSTTELILYGSGSLSYMMNQATFGSNKPDLILTTRDLWSKFESLIEPQKRYYGNKDNSALGKAGFTTLQFHNADVVSDVYCTAKSMFGIDSSAFNIVHSPDFNFKTEEWTKLEQAGYPYAMMKTCAWVGNIKCIRRKSNFKFTLLDYTI